MKNENIIYLVLSNLNHEGNLYQKGALIDGDYSPVFINLVRDGIIKEVLGASTFKEAKKILETEETSTLEETTPEVEPENTWGGRKDDQDDDTTPAPEEYKGEMKNYKITGDAFYTDEKGVKTETLELGSIHNLPVEVGQIFVDGNVAEEVIEETKGVEVETPENKTPEVTGENL